MSSDMLSLLPCALRRRRSYPSRLGDVAAFIDHHRPSVFDDDGAVLIEASGLEGDNADVRAGFRFTLLEHFAARVDRVALEYRIRQPYFVPPKIRHRVLGNVGDRLPRHERER